jgi:PhnB protein
MSTGLAPHLTIREGAGRKAIDFYKSAFAAEEITTSYAEDGKRVMHSDLLINGAHLLLNDDFPEYTGGVNLPSAVTIHIQVDDADAWWERAVQAGAIVHMPLGDQFWGQRYGQLVDPFGHHWSIAGPLKQ